MRPIATSLEDVFIARLSEAAVMRCVIAAALLLIALPAAAVAQPEPAGAVSLTLDDAIRRGLETSHRLAEAIARGEAAGAAADQRHAAQLPQVAAQAGYTRTNHVQEFGVLLPNNQLRIIYPDLPDNFRTRLDVQWPLYTGGRLAAFERAARTEAAALSNELDAARADLRLEVTRAYWSSADGGRNRARRRRIARAHSGASR